jgi:hypothetical protein
MCTFTVKCPYKHPNVHKNGHLDINLRFITQKCKFTVKCPFLQTFGCKFEVYNTEMQIYGKMTVKHLYIIQAVLDTVSKKRDC